MGYAGRPDRRVSGHHHVTHRRTFSPPADRRSRRKASCHRYGAEERPR
jgi:hypothetical protein